MYRIFRRLFLLSALLAVMAPFAVPALAQQKNLVTLDVKEELLEKVLLEIERQTNYTFSYSSSVIDVKLKVTCSVIQEDAKQVVGRILSGTGIGYEFRNRQIVLFPKKQQKETTDFPDVIRGKVTDE